MDLTTHPAKYLKRHKNNEVSSPHLIETKFEPKLSFFKWLIFFQQFTLHLEQTVFRVSNSAKHTFVLCERSLLELYDNLLVTHTRFMLEKYIRSKYPTTVRPYVILNSLVWWKRNIYNIETRSIVKTKFKITLN